MVLGVYKIGQNTLSETKGAFWKLYHIFGWVVQLKIRKSTMNSKKVRGKENIVNSHLLLDKLLIIIKEKTKFSFITLDHFNFLFCCAHTGMISDMYVMKVLMSIQLLNGQVIIIHTLWF